MEVTAEWKRVGENDTVPAGVHVRMDLSTGEKWVKLIDDKNDDETTMDSTGPANPNNQFQTSRNFAATTAMAEVKQGSMVEGGGLDVVVTTTTSDITASATRTISSGGEGRKSSSDPDFDYEMMHRTLSQLPDEEKQRIGGLPELPGPTERMDPVRRQKFEQRMKQIWTQRQEELKQLSDEVVADLPQLLKDRIRSIHQYLENPEQHLVRINLEEVRLNVGNHEEDELDMANIVAVLQDLEYHLADLDMTRDFYTLGGWPLLVSLLSDSVHQSKNSTTSPLLSSEGQAKVSLIQTHAAWAIGTAVKNTEEFHSFAVEDVVINGRQETPLTLMLQLVVADPRNDDVSNEKYFANRQTKALYALSSLLRGNRMAQIHFCAGDGPQQLGNLLHTSATHPHVPSGMLSKDVVKRLLVLAHDIVRDVELHAGRSPQIDQSIVMSFASEPWCQAVVHLIGPNPSKDTSSRGGGGGNRGVVVETALQSFVSLASYCNFDVQQGFQQVAESLLQLQQTWKNESNEMDPDHWQERQNLIESALNLVKAK